MVGRGNQETKVKRERECLRYTEIHLSTNIYPLTMYRKLKYNKIS